MWRLAERPSSNPGKKSRLYDYLSFSSWSIYADAVSYTHLDVYKRQHNIPYKSAPDALALPAEEFQAKFGFSKPAKDAELVVFCAAGRRAEGAQGKAVANGYTNVSIYPGSMNDWVAKGGDKIQW